MALQPQMTLGDARAEVMARLGFRNTPSSGTSKNTTVDSFIRSAAKILAATIDWKERRRKVRIALVEDQTVYDWPDEAEIGQILAVRLVDTDGRTFPIKQGSVDYDADWGSTLDSGRPLVFEYVDREIHLSPAPDGDWAHLDLRVELALPPLIQESEILPFDSELIILHALVATANRYNMQAKLRHFEREYAIYHRAVKGGQQNKRVMSMVGKSPVSDYEPSIGHDAVYRESWKPWVSRV